MIKTFRGILADGETNRIRLSTKKGKIGYRIIKFQTIPFKPGQTDNESTITIYKIDFTPLATIDLADGNILGVSFFSSNDVAQESPEDMTVIFEREIFNQDIYIGNQDSQSGALAMNYYLELETETLTDNAAALSTLRDIRLNPQVV